MFSRKIPLFLISSWGLFFFIHAQLVNSNELPDSDSPTSKPIQVFSSNHSLNLAFVGDIMMGGSAAHKLKTNGPDSFFTHVSPLLKQADIVTGNLEGPLGTEGVKFPNKKYNFLVDPSSALGLAHAGFKILTLANNHTMDFGLPALQSTLKSLENSGLKHSGAGINEAEARHPAWFNAKGHKVAVLAYSLTEPSDYWARGDQAGCASASGPEIRQDIAKARSQSADLIIVCFHWGQEKKTRLRDYQPTLAHFAIDAGADAVVGHHPHIWQGLEVYHGKPIAYSLGNFCFGSFSSTTTQSGILCLSFDQKNQWVGGKIIPLNVNNYQVWFCPTPMKQNQARNFLRYLTKLSKKTKLIQEDDLTITWQAPERAPEPQPGQSSKKEISQSEEISDEVPDETPTQEKEENPKGSLPGL